MQIDLGGGRIAGWASADYLAQNPDVAESIGVSVAMRPRDAGGGLGTVPADAFGCNLDVCIDLYGTNETILRWGTQAFGSVGCQYAYFSYPTGYKTGPRACPDGLQDGVYYDYTGPTGYFRHGSQLCNSWTVTEGTPCKYILR